MYTYNGTPPTSLTITDQLGRVTTVDYNGQGQPTSIQDPAQNPATQIQYYSTSGDSTSGDLKSVTDPIGNTTTYVEDSDGRVTTVTSPLQETTQYFYDALDDVKQVTDPLGNLTCNTFDLIGELASTTPPKGVGGLNGLCANINSAFTTIITRSANLAKTTVTDPLGNTTVTDLDGQGRKTDFTDKRGIETTYNYDKFGRLLNAFFNENNKSPYNQEKVQMSGYDELDRADTVSDTLSNSTLSYTYDAFDSVLTEGDSLTNNTNTYGYDPNGRRTSLAPKMNGIAEPTVEYGYDCADELVGISNNGIWTPPSCSPSTMVNYDNNITSAAQVAFDLDADGNPFETLVDGVETLITARDADERIKAETFGAFSSASPSASPTPAYGTLTYTYDADGRLIDKGGTLAAINIPSAVSTTSYSDTDQVTKWNGQVTTPDAAGNLTYDPATGADLTWNARNQLSASSYGTESYDGLGRRESSVAGSNTLNFEHDGSSVIGWNTAGSNPTYSFLTGPGGSALAGSFTSGGTTTTWVPLIDASGSTIALENAASPQSTPATTYTYDPSGNPTMTGTANDWPFQYNGMEKEFTDGPYYYTGSGQFYSPDLSRSLTQAGETDSQGGCPSGNAIGAPGSSGSDSYPLSAVGYVPPGSSKSGQTAQTTITVAGAAGAGATLGALIGAPFGAPYAGALIGAAVGAIVGGIASLFGDLFGGGSAPVIPRQLRHNRHPLYSGMLGVSDGLIPDEVSSGLPPIYGDPHLANKQPVGKKSDGTKNDCQKNVANAWAACGILQGSIGIDLHVICPFATYSCACVPNPWSCGMMVGSCGSAGLLDYWCYRQITDAEAACK